MTLSFGEAIGNLFAGAASEGVVIVLLFDAFPELDPILPNRTFDGEFGLNPKDFLLFNRVRWKWNGLAFGVPATNFCLSGKKIQG